jgi:predicted nucleic acid-binding Zn ribbon protein
MATYNYMCSNGCTLEKLKESKNEIKTPYAFIVVNSGDLVWEVEHSMKKDPKIKCPLCGKKAVKTVQGVGMPMAYIRGYGYLDRAGCRRDMDLHKLQTGQDPYASMRQPGEVDDLKNKLRRGGKHGGKNRKYFT